MTVASRVDPLLIAIELRVISIYYGTHVKKYLKGDIMSDLISYRNNEKMRTQKERIVKKK